jgi:ubiquinone/menaquinone biosynthesis C-methylase UbiE
MAKMTGFEKYFVNRRGERFFEKLIDDLETSGTLKITGNSRILELGGGNGALSSLIYKRYQPASYTFTDYDPDQLALAQESMKERFGEVPESFTFQQADAADLVYKNGSFDLVIAHLILHHLGGTDAIFSGLNEISRVLVPGGTFLYTEFSHKKEIRAKLTEMSYAITYKKGLHRENVVAVKQTAKN